jgi:hypothetical protein
MGPDMMKRTPILMGLADFSSGKGRADEQNYRKNTHSNSQFPSSVEHVHPPFEMRYLNDLPMENTL